MKIAQFQKILKKEHIDIALFIAGEQSDPSITYFTQLPSVTHTALIIPSQGKSELFLSPLDYTDAKKISAIKNITLLGKKPLLTQIKYKYSPQTIGINYPSVPFSFSEKLRKEFPKTKLVNTTSALNTLRATKTNEELELIEQATTIATHAYEKTIASRDLKTESDVKALLEYHMQKHDASPSFPTIVASGKNASTPHHNTSTDKLVKGFCVIDFGARYQGYCSDCTRTIFIGIPSQKDKQFYSILKVSQEKALAAVKPNAQCSKIDQLSRTILGNHQKYFTHSLGHGVGIEVHESPSLSPKSKDILKTNMVITVEPGIYIPNKLGIRIEDMTIVGKKMRVLTTLTKDLIRL